MPERSCFACGRKVARRDLIRLVRISPENVEIDLEGEKTGRGAYLCNQSRCWKQGVSKTRLDAVLRCSVGKEVRDKLLAYSVEVIQPSVEYVI